MLRNLTLAAAAAVALAAPLASQKADGDTTFAPPRSGPFLGFVIQGALEMGGESIGTVVFTDGSDQDVRAGQGGTVAVGGELRPAYASPVFLRGTVGYKYLTTAATNVNITLTRVPLELLAGYEFEGGFHAAAGVVHETSVAFDADGMDHADFDPATGPRVELGWRWLSLTYTGLRYRAESGEEFDASSAGVNVRYTFGRRRPAKR
jgi:hypothetical protein